MPMDKVNLTDGLGAPFYGAVAKTTDGTQVAAAHVLVDSNVVPLNVALDGTDATGLTPPTGAVGIRGWLSSIWNVLANGTLKVVIQTGSFVLGKVGLQVGGADVAGGNPIPVYFPTGQTLPTGAAQDGTDGTGITPPTGGVGIRGWLSGIYQRLGATIAISAATLPLPTGAAQDGTDGTGITPPTGAVGMRGWLSGVYLRLAGVALDASIQSLRSDIATLSIVLQSSAISSLATYVNDNRVTATLTANGNVCAINPNGAQTIGFEVAGTWTGTLHFESEVDGVLVATPAIPLGGGAAVTTATANGSWEMLGGGTGTVQVRLGNDTSITGSVAVVARATNGQRIVRVFNDTASNLQVQTPTLSTAPVTGQAKIATTGTAVALGSNALQNGVAIKARASNVAPILVGGSGVANTSDGTGGGVILDPGEAFSFAVANTNLLSINGTAGDMISFGGN